MKKILLVFTFLVFTSMVAGLFVFKKISPNFASKEIFKTPSIALNFKGGLSGGSGGQQFKTLEITESDLKNAIQSSLEERIQNLSVEINEENIIIKGDLKYIFTSNVTLKIKPKVENQKLVLEIIDINSPSLVKKLVINTISSFKGFLENQINDKIIVEDVTLLSGEMIITGKEK